MFDKCCTKNRGIYQKCILSNLPNSSLSIYAVSHDFIITFMKIKNIVDLKNIFRKRSKEKNDAR